MALAQWQYYLATGDQGWLRARGWPVLQGAAVFWASRAERGTDGRYHINQVEGPDEQNWPVDDPVYTNATARLTLELATRAARLLGLDLHPAQPGPVREAPLRAVHRGPQRPGAFIFLTGEGGFLQEFLYGYTGLRWREDRLRLDPMLPPQLAGGLRLTGLRWQGRVFDVALGPETSTLTLRSGAPAPVETPAGTRTVSVGTPLRMATRTAGPDAGNLARCQPVEANAADPSARPWPRSTAAPSAAGRRTPTRPPRAP